jgi:hypothetical protein
MLSERGKGGRVSGRGPVHRGTGEGERGRGGHRAPPGRCRRHETATRHRAPKRGRDWRVRAREKEARCGVGLGLGSRDGPKGRVQARRVGEGPGRLR